MPISESTVKRLFAKSHNQCAMPRCTSPLIIGEHVLGEICHIRARRKTGARYDPNLSPEQRDSFGNLILLCPTCHTLADKAPGIYTAELLGDIKEIHERDAPLEITAEVARQALMIFEKHRLKKTNSIRRSSVKSQTQATATAGGIAIAIGGHNQGPITVNLPKKEYCIGSTLSSQ